jgi:hypothetical protein
MCLEELELIPATLPLPGNWAAWLEAGLRPRDNPATWSDGYRCSECHESMKFPRRASFSLLTLFLWITIAALLMSHVSMRRELAAARSELDDARRQFGYLRIDDPNLIFVARIQGNELGANTYRLHIPSGHRFLLHLADTEIPDGGPPNDPKPTQTISMNSWGNGADVVLHWQILIDKGTPTFQASTESEQLFDYVLANWKNGPGSDEGAQLQAVPQASFRVDQNIRFMWLRNPNTKRGIVFWMAPLK